MLRNTRGLTNNSNLVSGLWPSITSTRGHLSSGCYLSRCRPLLTHSFVCWFVRIQFVNIFLFVQNVAQNTPFIFTLLTYVCSKVLGIWVKEGNKSKEENSFCALTIISGHLSGEAVIETYWDHLRGSRHSVPPELGGRVWLMAEWEANTYQSRMLHSN